MRGIRRQVGAKPADAEPAKPGPKELLSKPDGGEHNAGDNPVCHMAKEAKDVSGAQVPCSPETEDILGTKKTPKASDCQNLQTAAQVAETCKQEALGNLKEPSPQNVQQVPPSLSVAQKRKLAEITTALTKKADGKGLNRSKKKKGDVATADDLHGVKKDAADVEQDTPPAQESGTLKLSKPIKAELNGAHIKTAKKVSKVNSKPLKQARTAKSNVAQQQQDDVSRATAPNIDKELLEETAQETKALAKKKAKSERLQRMRQERESKGLLLLPEKVERKIYLVKKAMRKKGLPGDQIKEAVRKMRRKEELLFRRQLAKLCFKCRQPGHKVSDCPVMLQETDQAVGICFKCGSTEHFSSACTVKTNKDNEFPFAKCFICQQQGHLSRKCPKNKRGVYPHGGHCNFCGAIDHFKLECPEMERNKKKQEPDDQPSADVTDVTQSADAEKVPPPEERPKPKKAKVVSF